MGTILSSNQDYNRTLAKQPRKPIDISKFDLTNNLQQYPLVGTLSIPVPVHNSQLNNKNPVISNEPSRSKLNQTSTQHNLTPVINNQPSSENQLMHQNLLFPFQPNYSIHNQTMNNDVFIVSRSTMNLNNHRRLNGNHLSSFRPNRSIVERNGKQFLTEVKERMERRYVEVFDETTGRMRLFEVTDYIPSRTVRAMKPNVHFQSQNGISRNPLPPNFSSNHRPPLSSMPNNQTEPTITPSNLVGFNGLNNGETVAREFDLYHSGAPLPNASHLPSTTHQSNDSNDSHSQPKTNNTSTIPSQPITAPYTSRSYRSQAQSFRPHSPTGSDYSVNISHSNSESGDSDSEGIDQTSRSNNRNNTNVSYGTLGGHNSPTQLDPFKRTINTHDPYYKKRPGVNNYSEPIANNRRFQNSSVSDYAPIPVPHNQSNQYSRRNDSNVYDG